MKAISVVGARPQFVKASVVMSALSGDDVAHMLVHTGQHYDDNMAGRFLRELELPAPAYALEVGSVTHGAQTGRMLEAVERVLLAERPEIVVVYGDTNSTIAAALAAAKLRIPVAHVEAGLRSFNRSMPEEVNRIVTDHLSELLFAPTAGAVEQLASEGISGARVALVGDVMYDAALQFGARADRAALPDELQGIADYVLATIHRAETTDVPTRLERVFAGLRALSEHGPVVLPLHPRTREILRVNGSLAHATRGLILVEPVGYTQMLRLERHARLIVTDSGGVQKEAFFCRTPCVTLRAETEWTELVDLGWNRLVPPDALDLAEQLLASRESPGVGQDAPADLYGGGQAGQRIAERIRGHLGRG